MRNSYRNASLLKISLLCSMLFICVSAFSQSSATKDDRQLVHDAVENYLLALYNVEPELIAKSVDPTLRKIGYYEKDGKYYDNLPMTYQQLYDLAGKWNKSGEEVDDNSPRQIDIYEVHNKTASAKLTAEWGIDFMHLSKVDGQWKIMNIIWQSPPK